nr:arginase family protein [Rhizobium leguminosarum]
METLEYLERSVSTLVQRGIVRCGIGGKHSLTLAELRAVAARHGPLALIHFDAHSDTWDNYFGGKNTAPERECRLSSGRSRWIMSRRTNRSVDEDIVVSAIVHWNTVLIARSHS